MIGHNGNINAIIGFLESQDRDYKLATRKKDQDRIQDNTRKYMDDVNDDIYAKLTDGSATGLFGTGHSFRQDMGISLMRLRDMLHNE